MRSKALLAIVFAGGLLNSQLPALSENKIKSTEPVLESESKSTDSVIQQIADNASLTPEWKAFYLLLIASRYLNGDSETTVDAQFKSAATETADVRNLYHRKNFWERSLVSFADRVSEDRSSNMPSISHETFVLADTAIRKALPELHEVAEPFAKLNMYFIASRLFQKMGNTDETYKCNEILEKTFKTYEKSSTVYEDQIGAASSVLNSMANGVIAVHISDSAQRVPQTQITATNQEDFDASQKLKLRALAMVDRLDPSNHVRRKTHRDLTLWYLQLGKDELAEKEKLVLFELVGIHDDSILYPQSLGCGQIVWWKIASSVGMLCGMG